MLTVFCCVTDAIRNVWITEQFDQKLVSVKNNNRKHQRLKRSLNVSKWFIQGVGSKQDVCSTSFGLCPKFTQLQMLPSFAPLFADRNISTILISPFDWNFVLSLAIVILRKYRYTISKFLHYHCIWIYSLLIIGTSRPMASEKLSYRSHNDKQGKLPRVLHKLRQRSGSLYQPRRLHNGPRSFLRVPLGNQLWNVAPLFSSSHPRSRSSVSLVVPSVEVSATDPPSQTSPHLQPETTGRHGSTDRKWRRRWKPRWPKLRSREKSPRESDARRRRMFLESTFWPEYDSSHVWWVNDVTWVKNRRSIVDVL